MPKPRILVTGATGKTGAPTALGLLKRGYPVRALVRQSDERAEGLQQAGSEIAFGSLEDFRDVTRHGKHRSGLLLSAARARNASPLAGLANHARLANVG